MILIMVRRIVFSFLFLYFTLHKGFWIGTFVDNDNMLRNKWSYGAIILLSEEFFFFSPIQV